MKKRLSESLSFFILFLLLVSYLLVCKKPTFALWEKFSENPILEGKIGNWNYGSISNPHVKFIEGIYRLWYGGYNGTQWQIGYGESHDGIQWNDKFSPVIKPNPLEGWDEKEISHPTVIYSPNASAEKKYEIWYSAISHRWPQGEDRFRVKYAFSSDGLHWNEYPKYVMKGSPGTWDSGGITRGISVIKTPKGYEMWYTGIDTGNLNWKIGYATSSDGIKWEKFHNNPVITPTKWWEKSKVSYPNVLYENGIYHMFYITADQRTGENVAYAYSYDGVNWYKPENINPILERGINKDFDSQDIVTPSVLKQGALYRMWYSGFDGNKWSIGHAQGTIEEITPTPSPTPTPLPPLVFLPGLGGSWNFENLILGIEKPDSEWTLTPGPGRKVYAGLLETFKNAGYKDNNPDKNLFVYPYNWTKPASQIAKGLKNFIENTIQPSSSQKIILVGHSLGGFVGRVYLQENPESQLEKLLSLGSPHQGVVQVYYPWEGGDLQLMNPLERISIGLLLAIRRQEFATDKEVIQQIAPILKDLLPTFNYLKNNGNEISWITMKEKNQWLDDLNNSFPPSLSSLFYSLFSNIPESTPRWININPQNWLEKILNLWPDGKPQGPPTLAIGDKTVLSESAQIEGIQIVQLKNLDHEEIVKKKEGQEKIMEVLGLSPSSISLISEDFSEEPALVFLIASPANIEVFDQNGNKPGEGDGRLIIISPAPPGDYKIKIQGIGTGLYHLFVGQITPKGDYWQDILGQIEEGKSQNRTIKFQPDSPLLNPFDKQFIFQSAYQRVLEFKREIKKNITSPSFQKVLLAKINNLLREWEETKIEKMISLLYQIHFSIIHGKKTGKITPEKAISFSNQIIKIVEELEDFYIKNNPPFYSSEEINREIFQAENLLKRAENKLKVLYQQGKTTPFDGYLYLLGEKKINQAKFSSSWKAHFSALAGRYFSLEGIVLFSN